MISSGQNLYSPLQREVRYRHIINRLGMMVAFLAFIILALIAMLVFRRAGANEMTLSENKNSGGNVSDMMPHAMNYKPEEGKPNGEQLFEQKCASCHQVSTENITGPGLLGVSERIPAGDWKYKWITNPAAMRDQEDPYALKIIAESNGNMMTPQNLSDEEIDEIFRYIDAH
ncbi:MAG: cytochrome c class I [Bacteroidetes bacterium]|nr:MAG: cytochrome c class I [Bacteroidota bacterium]